MIPTTSISIHLVNRLKAKALGSHGAPLVLTVEGSYSDTEITLFLDNHELVQQIADTINAAYEYVTS